MHTLELQSQPQRKSLIGPLANFQPLNETQRSAMEGLKSIFVPAVHVK